MIEYLLHPRNLKILESFCLAKTLFAFDYDGTLAPIVANPEKASMKDSTSDLLGTLMMVSPVAVITGRSIADVQKHLPVRPAHIIGNHGSEGVHTSEELADMHALTRVWLKTLEMSLPLLQKLGISVEDKAYSLAFHYRLSPNPLVAEGALELISESFVSSRITRGKFVLNILPKKSVDKGIALEKIMKQNRYQFGVFFGDDLTDEDVFKHHNPRLLTVKIGTEPTQAKFYLRDQSEMDEVLTLIISYLK